MGCVTVPGYSHVQKIGNVASTSRSLFVHFTILENWKLENMLLLLQPLWVIVLSLVHAKGNKDDRSAQAVQYEASKSRLLDGAETPLWRCARQSQRFGNDPAAGGEDDGNHTRVALLERLFGQVREGKDLSEEILTNVVCSRIY